MTLGNRIAYLRKQQGLTQATLAKRLSVCPSTVGMYEQGRRVPSSELLASLSQELHVSINYLLTGQEPICFAVPGPYGFLVILEPASPLLAHPTVIPLSQDNLQQILKTL
jgi:transcriptional regulator with XRE-family HTH domain